MDHRSGDVSPEWVFKSPLGHFFELLPLSRDSVRIPENASIWRISTLKVSLPSTGDEPLPVAGARLQPHRNGVRHRRAARIPVRLGVSQDMAAPLLDDFRDAVPGSASTRRASRNTSRRVVTYAGVLSSWPYWPTMPQSRLPQKLVSPRSCSAEIDAGSTPWEPVWPR